MTAPLTTDFDDWLVRTYARIGSFTILIILIDIGAKSVRPLRSTYLHVVGDETRWPEMIRLFDGAGVSWNGAAFFQADSDGLVADPEARQRLASLVRHLNEDRKILNDGEFFDRRGLRLKLEEIAPH
ncbi:MAG: uncharacterized protein JWM91_4431 [Rhodospirillales bacterium]|nr:uncharacterized protein [Rhodospirillales bacterium]